MPLEDGLYCRYCTDENGNLQEFEERLERMAQFMLGQKKANTQAEARQKAVEYMADMPAWRDNPKLKSALRELAE